MVNIDIDKEELYDYYINKKYSIQKIAKLYKHDSMTISKLLDKYNIPKRHQKFYRDLTGITFGRLTAIYPLDSNFNANTIWHCLCECGNTKDISARNLIYDVVQSCGCLKREKTIEFNKKTKTKINQYDLSGDYGVGWTSNTNEIFLFDLEDYDKIKNYCWSEGSDGYLIARERDGGGTIRMHQLVMDDKYIDHIKHDKLDNRKSELRKSCDLLNSRNRVTPKNNKSGYKGVCWDNTKNMWRAYISYKKQHIELGFYNNIEDAIKAREKADNELFKDWSYENSMNMDTQN